MSEIPVAAPAKTRVCQGTRFLLPRPCDRDYSTTPGETRDPVTNYSKYQQNIIRNYYDNRDTIALQRAQELVTELYLSEGKKRKKFWEQLAGHLVKLGVKQAQIDHLVAQDNPEMAAKMVQSLFEKQK